MFFFDSYFLTGALANLRTLHDDQLACATRHHIDSVISDFLDSVKEDQIFLWEESNSYVWISLLPFVQLAFSPGVCVDCRIQQASSSSVCQCGKDVVRGSTQVQQFGLFCLTQLCMRQLNCDMLVDESLMNCLRCLPWSLQSSDEQEQLSTKIANWFKSDRYAAVLSPPSLADLSLARLAPVVGFHEAYNVARHQRRASPGSLRREHLGDLPRSDV